MLEPAADGDGGVLLDCFVGGELSVYSFRVIPVSPADRGSITADTTEVPRHRCSGKQTPHRQVQPREPSPQQD